MFISAFLMSDRESKMRFFYRIGANDQMGHLMESDQCRTLNEFIYSFSVYSQRLEETYMNENKNVIKKSFIHNILTQRLRRNTRTGTAPPKTIFTLIPQTHQNPLHYSITVENIYRNMMP